MVIWYILIVVSLLLNIYCIINIFHCAGASEAQFDLTKLRGMQIEELQKEIEYLKARLASTQQIPNSRYKDRQKEDQK